MNIRQAPVVLVGLILFASTTMAETYSMIGDIGIITDNTGQSVFAAATVGDALHVSIDTVTAAGSVAVGAGPSFNFSCCIAAGGAEPVDNVALDVETALTVNLLLGNDQFSAGDIVDIFQVEGDQLTPSGSRIEAGVTFVLNSSAITEGEPYVLQQSDVLVSIGFVLEEFMDEDIFSAIGLVFRNSDEDDVPDLQDNCTLATNPSQLDSDNDGIGNACDPDVDNNCAVNFLDFLFFPPAFGSQTGDANFDVNMDFDEDGAIGFLDLSVIASFFGQPPGPSNQACTVSP